MIWYFQSTLNFCCRVLLTKPKVLHLLRKCIGTRETLVNGEFEGVWYFLACPIRISLYIMFWKRLLAPRCWRIVLCLANFLQLAVFPPTIPTLHTPLGMFHQNLMVFKLSPLVWSFKQIGFSRSCYQKKFINLGWWNRWNRGYIC